MIAANDNRSADSSPARHAPRVAEFCECSAFRRAAALFPSPLTIVFEAVLALAIVHAAILLQLGLGFAPF